MDELEKYLRDNRHRANSQHPPDEIWQRVQKNIHPKQPTGIIQVSRWWLIAAGVAIVLGFLSIYINVVRPSQQLLVKLDDRLMNIDKHYASQMGEMQAIIDDRRSEIEEHMVSYPGLQQIFSNDVKQLNDTYDDLRDNLLELENEEVLLKAMMSNLQLQIQVLNRQLDIIQKIKRNQKNEQISPTI